MLDLHSLQTLHDQVRRPSFDALEQTARRRDRRTGLTAALACAVSALVVVGAAFTVRSLDQSSGPEPLETPTPTLTTSADNNPTPSASTHQSPTSMTPEEVVHDPNARLVFTGVSADDPDFRLSVWEAVCGWCPRTPADSRFPHPTFRGMAITTDGFASATYRRPIPFAQYPVHVESPGPGLLLIVDAANGYEWLVREDGTVTRLARDFDLVRPASSRMWFVCDDDLDREADGTGPYGPQQTWCALDPKANLVHVWEGPWTSTLDDTRSALNPDEAVVPWGLRDPAYGPDPGLSAWWESDGSRQYHDLSDDELRGPVYNAPLGLMSYWSWSPGSSTIHVFTSSEDRSMWGTTELRLRYRPDPYNFKVYWTPEGALLARQDNAFSTNGSGDEGDGLRILRAEFEAGGAFTPVYEARTGNLPHVRDLPFSFLDGTIWASDLWSEDDGRTWSEVTTWR